MKAIVISHAGGPDELKLTAVPTPAVKPGWSLVQIKGFGINRSEVVTREGGSPTVKFPRILGIEGVGVIAETTDPARLPVGQKVAAIMGGMGRDFDGSYAEYALLPNASIYPVTTSLSWADFAAVPETFFTAYGALVKMHIKQAKTLLVRGGTSGVGNAAMKLAHAMNPGIQVTGTTRDPGKKAQLLEAGFDAVVLDVDAKVQTDGHYDAVLELVGAQTLMDSLSHLNTAGVCCLCGGLGGQWTVPDFDPFVVTSGAYFTTFTSGTVTEAAFNDMLQVIEAANIPVSPRKVFDLAHTADAQAALDAPDSFGKVVVVI